MERKECRKKIPVWLSDRDSFFFKSWKFLLTVSEELGNDSVFTKNNWQYLGKNFHCIFYSQNCKFRKCLNICILTEVQNFQEIVQKFSPHVSSKEITQGVSDLILALAVIRFVVSFSKQVGSALQETLFPPQLNSKFNELCLKSVNLLCFCFRKCFQNVIITFLIDCLCETERLLYWKFLKNNI